MNKLLVEPYINNELHGYPVQAEKFSLVLKITNQNNNPSDEFTISNISLESAERKDITEDFDRKTFLVNPINPGQSLDIKIGENGSFMHGLISLNIDATPKDSSKQINFLQKNPFTGKCSELRFTNKWVDFLYIKSANQSAQEKSSKWVMRLTWATAIFALIQIVPILFHIYKGMHS